MGRVGFVNRATTIIFDWQLFLKIEASLYSVFLKEMPS